VARSEFGGVMAAWVVSSTQVTNASSAEVRAVTLLADAMPLSLYDAPGGTEVTDFLDETGQPVTQITALPSDPYIPRFSGPDGVTSLWVQAEGGRWLPVPRWGDGSGNLVTEEDVLNLGDARYVQSSQFDTLGDAATRDVGTTAGTVAAGDSVAARTRTTGVVDSLLARSNPAPSADVPAFAVTGPGGAAPFTGVTYPFDTTNVSYVGCVPVTFNQFSTDYIQNKSTGAGPAPWAVEFVTGTADLFIPFRAATTAPALWVWVDGRPATLGPQIYTSNISPGSKSYLRLTFTEAKRRRIRVGMKYADFGGLTVTTGSTATAPQIIERVKVYMLGDSWFDNVFDAHWPYTIPAQVGMTLAWNTFLGGIPGTGYINGSVAFGNTTRTSRLYAANPDYVVVFGSINDNGATGIQAAASALYAGIATNLPNAKIIVVGPQPVPASPNPNLFTNRDAVKAAALAAPNVLAFVDPIADTWLAGSGNVSAPTGDGNRDYYVGSDAIHPTALGAGYFARRIVEEITRILTKASRSADWLG
jgi:lysophospholipase L1-like esterase